MPSQSRMEKVERPEFYDTIVLWNYVTREWIRYGKILTEQKQFFLDQFSFLSSDFSLQKWHPCISASSKIVTKKV